MSEFHDSDDKSQYNRKKEDNLGGSWVFGSMRGAERLPPKEQGNNSIDKFLIEQHKRQELIKPLAQHRSKYEAIEMRRDNIFSQLRDMMNQIDYLVYAENHDKTGMLSLEGKSMKKEILDRRRRYGKADNLEQRILSEALFWIKPEESEGQEQESQ